MEKQCTCGFVMNIRLRTVIFSNKVAIENVPLLCCDKCSRSEVFPEIKQDLAGLIKGLGDNPFIQQLHFEELNELAHLMYKVSDNELLNIPVELIVEERINHLLDLLLLAKSLEDEEWIADLYHRLSQISKHASSTYNR